jgi:HEAT repeat protein
MSAAWIPGAAAGQDLGARLEGMAGEITFHFEGREGIQGCGDGSISFGENDWHRWDSDRRGSDCGPGPVLVELRLRDGEVRGVDTRVGPGVQDEPGRDGDLGRVDPRDAADYLLTLAESGSGSVAEDAILPAFLARDVEVWPRLIELARDRSRPEDVRSQALFWVGQEARGVGTEGLAEVARDESEDQDVRGAAVFALSQRPEDEGLPILMEVARDATDPETRQSAMFWLAQSDDPEVVDFFEEILSASR